MGLWNCYNYIAVLMIASQLIFLLQMYKNYVYAIKKSAKRHDGYRPRTLLTVPCKGADNVFEENIASFFNLDYDDFYLWFVVEDSSDAAYEKLCKLKGKLAATS